MRKSFVLDTSVFIHDPNCIFSFKGNTVCIPIFVIIELDDLKISQRSNVAYLAREASRSIVTVRDQGSLNNPEGVYLEEEDVTVKVIGSTSGVGIKALQESNNPRKMDLWILESGIALQKDLGEEGDVVLISKDINLRLLAEAEGLVAEDYESDKVDVDDMYTGFQDVGENPQSDLTFYEKVPSDEFMEDPIENEFYLSQHRGKEFLSRNVGGFIRPVPQHFGIKNVNWRNIEQRMALDILMDPNIKLISLVGKAGTGKTFLALAAALEQLNKREGSHYDRIVLSKPIVDLGSGIGFLPGGLDEKMDPWMQSYYDNLEQLITEDNNPFHKKGGDGNSNKMWYYLVEMGMLQIQPINYIRGRSISNSIMIIDEAQNLTPHEITTILTRAAEGTKVIIMGDPFQIDHPFLDKNSNGLTFVTERMKGLDLFATVFFTEGVRSALAEEATNRLK